MPNNNVMNLNGPVQLKGGTAAALTAANPLLAQREIAVEVDTGRIKVGNGIKYWNDLPYSGSPSSDENNSTTAFNWPDSDDHVYVIQNAAFVKAVYVAKPAVWAPSIYDLYSIFITLDDDMTPFQLGADDNSLSLYANSTIQPLQLKGDNSEVNL